MYNHLLNVLGLDVSFTAQADPKRIERACTLLETRYATLSQHGGHLSKEKLLTLLALALADDLLVIQEEKSDVQNTITRLLASIEKGASPSA